MIPRRLRRRSRLWYFVQNFARLSVPRRIYQRRLAALLEQSAGRDAEEIRRRVDYYFRVREPFHVSAGAEQPHFQLFAKRHNYQFDLLEHVRRFDRSLRLDYAFGDFTSLPSHPTLVKARPIGPGNENAILFPLNKVRHFHFVEDDLSFESKIPKLVWRGRGSHENRRRFLERHADNPRCDVGEHPAPAEARWRKPYLTVYQQLRYRFVLSLEGNDVATNLKWILSSNSLCFMPRPRFETWFMEGTLIPDVHYVLLRDDFADVDEKLEHYTTHTDDARRILRNAHAYVARFRDPEREAIVSLLVLWRYFSLSGQLDAATPWPLPFGSAPDAECDGKPLRANES
jgi:Glycosyl transferase family 90